MGSHQEVVLVSLWGSRRSPPRSCSSTGFKHCSSSPRRHTMALVERDAEPAPLSVHWEVDSSSLRCVVRWPAVRPRLAQILPLFEHLGLVLADHLPENGADRFVFAQIEDVEAHQVPGLLSDAFTAAWERTVDRDEFAALSLQAHLRARQVQLVRAGCQYLRQAGLGASRSYVCEILASHREFVRNWVEVFEHRFDPDALSPAENRLATYADAATTRDEFRVLDWYAALLDSVTRTNFFRRSSSGEPSATI